MCNPFTSSDGITILTAHKELSEERAAEASSAPNTDPGHPPANVHTGERPEYEPGNEDNILSSEYLTALSFYLTAPGLSW